MLCPRYYTDVRATKGDGAVADLAYCVVILAFLVLSVAYARIAPKL